MKQALKETVLIFSLAVGVFLLGYLSARISRYVANSTGSPSVNARLTAIETQLAHDANCIATLEALQQAREEREAGR